MYLNFADIPAQQNLFLDYLYEFDNVAKFYNKNFRDENTYYDHFEKLSNFNRDHRQNVANIILEQYKNDNPSKKTAVNIESLKKNNTIAVVTGQQLGLFGGPLYTLYKSITAIKLTASLKEKYHQFNFVPVFWLEGDDHDYDEVRTVGLIDSSNQSIKLSYDDGKPGEFNRGSVADIKFETEINNVFSEIEEKLRSTEFTPAILQKLKSFYSEGSTFSEAFRKLIFEIFDSYGLVIFNPQDLKVKELLKPLFKKEIENFSEHSISVLQRSAEVEDLYHAQVKIKPINLFTHIDGGRYSIEPGENEFRLKGKRLKYTKDELLNQIENYPENFSPNVLLRPICQDYLLPTGFYIGGPSEISYFAQVIPLYEKFGLEQPFIYPRAAATILEKNLDEIISKFNLNFSDLLLDEKELIEKVLSTISSFDLTNLFTEAENEVTKLMKSLERKLNEVDPTLPDLVEKTEGRMIQGLNQLKGKAEKAESLRFDSSIRQIKKVRNIVYPNDNLQERELNFYYLVNKYGWEILKWLFDEISISKFEHQIIKM